MAKRVGGGNVYRKPYPKRTSQGKGRNTKYGSRGGGPNGSTTSKTYKKSKCAYDNTSHFRP